MQERFCPPSVRVHASVIFGGSWLHPIVSFPQYQGGTPTTLSPDVSKSSLFLSGSVCPLYLQNKNM